MNHLLSFTLLYEHLCEGEFIRLDRHQFCFRKGREKHTLKIKVQ